MYLCCKNEEELNSTLTEKQKETFEKFKDCTSELSCTTANIYSHLDAVSKSETDVSMSNAGLRNG